jgi:predicted KAP-like P-loop ATPase
MRKLPDKKDKSVPESDPLPEVQADEPRYSSDHPIHNPAEDRFNRWPFAKRIADTLRDRKDLSCLVLGIYGAWGEGKTSVLNLIELELKDCEPLAVVRFNPWYFRSEAVLITGLFETLAEGVGKKLPTKREQFGKALKGLSTFFSLASVSVGGVVSVNPGEGLEKIASQLSQTELTAQRNRVQTILKEAGLRVVVLIDDIDRLERQEIQALFKTVRLSADFERVAYVLAFDRDIVAASLGEKYGEGGTAQGRAFLDKIIQVPLHLPPAKKEALRQLVFEGAEEAANLAGIKLTQEQSQIIAINFVRSLEPRLSTPRQAQLYTNALLFALPILKGEVDVVDQMLIEGIRVLCPRLYETIRANPDAFLRSATATTETRQPDRAGPLIDEATSSETADQKNSVRDLLEYLFPRLENAMYGAEWEIKWAKEQRICSSKYFFRYFTYAIGSSEVSDVEFLNLLSALENAEELPQAYDAWKEFVTVDRAKSVIEKLREREEYIGGKLGATLISVIARTGSLYPREEQFYFYRSTFSQAAILVSKIISRMPAGSRPAAVDLVMPQAEPLEFAAELHRWLSPGNRPEEVIVGAEEFKPIEEKLSLRIAGKLRSEWAFSSYGKDMQHLLWIWKRNEARKGEVEDYILEGLRRDVTRMPEFLISFLGQGFAIGSGLPVRVPFERHSYDQVKSLVDPEKINSLIMETFGEHIEPGKFRFGEEVPSALAICNQFVSIHQVASQEGNTSQSEEVETQAGKLPEPEADEDASGD